MIVTLAFVTFTYFNNYYTYGNYARKAMRSTETVKVTRGDDYIFFDGSGSERALIFYPGAKVATEAYAPLMAGLADEGIDCFLLDMPFHFAMFGRDRASEVLEKYDYAEYIMAGHSLGGVVAAGYVAEHPKDFYGLVLMGSYPTEKIDDSVKFLSILGSEDGVINTEKYEEAKKNWPDGNSHDYLIFGGNHAGFGNYGEQDGDGDATIRQKKQWRQTIEAILEYM